LNVEKNLIIKTQAQVLAEETRGVGAEIGV